MKIINIVLIATLIVLVIVVVASIVAIILRYKDDKRFGELSTVATIITSVGTIVVGFATVYVMCQQEIRERNQHQPIYTINIRKNDLSKDGIYIINEEYQVLNEGAKTKVKTEVICHSFLEISYFDINTHGSVISRLCPIKNYFNWSIPTGNLDGPIAFSAYSGNNYGHYYDIHLEAMDYGRIHHGESVWVEMKHYFDIQYVDIYGEQHRVVKKDYFDIDSDQFDELREDAYKSANGCLYDITDITLDSLLNTFFRAELMKQ